MSSIVNSLLNRPYTLSELLQTDEGRLERAAGCSVELVDTFHEVRKATLPERLKERFLGKKLINSYNLIFKFRVTSDTGRSHIVFVKTEPDFNANGAGSKCQVYCDCKDFMYRSAYELNRRHSLFLNDKTNAALGTAITTAPKRQTGSLLCKHAYAALQWLLDNYSVIIRNA